MAEIYWKDSEIVQLKTQYPIAASESDDTLKEYFHILENLTSDETVKGQFGDALNSFAKLGRSLLSSVQNDVVSQHALKAESFLHSLETDDDADLGG